MSLLRRIIRAGIDDGRAGQDAKYLLVTNGLAVVTLPVLIPLVLLMDWATSVPLPILAVVYGLVAVGYALVPVLNTTRRHDAAVIVGGLSATGAAFVPCLLIGTAALGHLAVGLTLIAAWSGIPPNRRGLAWALSAVNLAGFLALQLHFRDAAPPYPVVPSRLFALQTINLCALLVMMLFFGVYVHLTLSAATAQLEHEQQKSDDLLHNVLPRAVADRLKSGATIADRFESCTVLFADLANFTPRAERVPPERLVAMLHDIFTRFDVLCDRLGLEKIKTIGDAYMVVGGVPTPRPDHVDAVADLALAMMEELAGLQDGPDAGEDSALPRLELRIGIHTGPVVAGVIGQRKFAYDLWGDTVNTASRMESHGVPGRIQTTEQVHQALHARFDFEPRGNIQIKGKGELTAYFLVGRRSA